MAKHTDLKNKIKNQKKQDRIGRLPDKSHKKLRRDYIHKLSLEEIEENLTSQNMFKEHISSVNGISWTWTNFNNYNNYGFSINDLIAVLKETTIFLEDSLRISKQQSKSIIDMLNSNAVSDQVMGASIIKVFYQKYLNRYESR